MSKKATSFDLLRWAYQDDEDSRRKTAEKRIISSAPAKVYKDYASIRNHQRASRICFGDAVLGSSSAGRGNKAISPEEANKHRGLNESVEEYQPRRPHISNAKTREVSGSNIFGKDPPKSPGRPATPERKRHMKMKSEEMSGNAIFKPGPPGSPPAEKLVCDAKIKELEGHDVFSDGEKPSPRDWPPDVLARIQQFNGTNPALPDEEASAYLRAHPKKMSDRYTSGSKIKEICGNYDLFCGQDCLDLGKTPLGFPPIGPHPAKRCELTGSDAFPPSTSFRYDGVEVPRHTEKHHGDVKRREILGNYDLISFAPSRRDYAGYIKCTPEEKTTSMSKKREMVGNQIFGEA